MAGDKTMDIAQRLLAAADTDDCFAADAVLMREAANEIQRLSLELDEWHSLRDSIDTSNLTIVNEDDYQLWYSGDSTEEQWPDGFHLNPVVAELDRLRHAQKGDARRLDWLDSMNAALNKHYGTTYQWKLILSPNVVRLMAGRGEPGFVGAIDLCDSNCGHDAKSSVREAIDDAAGFQEKA